MAQTYENEIVALPPFVNATPPLAPPPQLPPLSNPATNHTLRNDVITTIPTHRFHRWWAFFQPDSILKNTKPREREREREKRIVVEERDQLATDVRNSSRCLGATDVRRPWLAGTLSIYFIGFIISSFPFLTSWNQWCQFDGWPEAFSLERSRLADRPSLESFASDSASECVAALHPTQTRHSSVELKANCFNSSIGWERGEKTSEWEFRFSCRSFMSLYNIWLDFSFCFSLSSWRSKQRRSERSDSCC